jgi:hypothetical protein
LPAAQGDSRATGRQGLVVVDPSKVKIDSEVYKGVMREILPSIRRLHANTDAWLFVQDGAPCTPPARARSSSPAFLTKTEWPPHSPDLNVLDYLVWDALKGGVNEGGRTFDTREELEAVAKRAWKQIPMDSVRRAIDRFRPRFEAVVAEDGGHGHLAPSYASVCLGCINQQI